MNVMCHKVTDLNEFFRFKNEKTNMKIPNRLLVLAIGLLGLNSNFYGKNFDEFKSV